MTKPTTTDKNALVKPKENTHSLARERWTKFLDDNHVGLKDAPILAMRLFGGPITEYWKTHDDEFIFQYIDLFGEWYQWAQTWPAGGFAIEQDRDWMSFNKHIQDCYGTDLENATKDPQRYIKINDYIDQIAANVAAIDAAGPRILHEKPQTSALMAPVNEAMAPALDASVSPDEAGSPTVATGEKLDDWFPRKPAEPEPPVQKWIEDETQRSKFFKAVNNRFNKYKVSTDHKERLTLIHEWLSSELHETRYTEPEAEALVLDTIEKLFGPGSPFKTTDISTQPLAPSDTSVEVAQKNVFQGSPVNETSPVATIPHEATNGAKANVSMNGTEKALTVPQNGAVAMPAEFARWEVMRQQASVLLKSKFLPSSITTPEQAITIMMMGQALGIEPIVALNTINVIQGKPTVSPQLMLALVRKSGQLENISVTDDGAKCTVVMKRKGEDAHTETFSHDDAKRMGLATKDNWNKQPATMRKWRAIAAACRVVFPDVTWGIASYTTEELDPDVTVIEG